MQVDPNAEYEIHLHVVIRSTSPDPDKVAGLIARHLHTSLNDRVTVYMGRPSEPRDKVVPPLDWKAGELHAD